MAQSAIRQNFHVDCEGAINKQINMELYASYTYLSMSYYFDRDDVACPGLHKYFKKQSEEEREHAMKLMKYQNDRGGRLVMQSLMKPAKDEWGTPLESLQAALELEKSVNQSLLDLHKLSDSRRDPHLCDFLENEYLNEQVESIKELGSMITRLKRCGTGLGEYVFDKDLSS